MLREIDFAKQTGDSEKLADATANAAHYKMLRHVTGEEISTILWKAGISEERARQLFERRFERDREKYGTP
jgi:hypothetical protein